MKLIVPEIGPSFNKYQNLHYQKRAKLVRLWNTMISWEVKRQKVKPIERYPVTIHCKCYFGKGRRSYDWTNLSTTAKLIEDGLRHAGVLKDDSKKYVAWGKLESIKTNGDTYTEFIIEELDELS